jgi:hypothetical protein
MFSRKGAKTGKKTKAPLRSLRVFAPLRETLLNLKGHTEHIRSLFQLARALIICAFGAFWWQTRLSVVAEQQPASRELQGDIHQVHDPSIIKEGDTY